MEPQERDEGESYMQVCVYVFDAAEMGLMRGGGWGVATN